MRKRIKFVKVIEHILVALPLIYVGGVSLYTTFNKNAKDSYYGENINSYEIIEGYESLEETYYLPIQNISIESGQLVYSVDNVSIVSGSYTFYQDVSNIKELLFYTYNEIKYMRLTFDDNTNQFVQNTASTFNDFVFSFDLISVPVNPIFDDYIYYREYNTLSFLNNAIPYAMSEFNKFGFNQIRFVQPFLNLFHVGETNVYIEFVNNYINYFLFVECVYFVPMVLYWFIHFGEKIVNKLLDNEGGLQ